MCSRTHIVAHIILGVLLVSLFVLCESSVFIVTLPYQLVSGEFVAQLEIHKILIILILCPIRTRVFEPGGRRFDNLAVFGQVGRCRARRGGGPERSRGRAAQRRAQRSIGAERPKGGPEGVSAQRE